MIDTKRTFGATMLITGCCIGAGMIGLPVMSALAGFLPATAAMALVYVFTTASGLLLLEATLWFDREANLASIAELTLGKAGKNATLILFMFLFYCIFVAYLDSGGLLISEMLNSLFNIELSQKAGIVLCLGLVSAITYAGTKLVDNLNRALVFGLAVTYFALVSMSLPLIEKDSLAYANWASSIAIIPILMICFGFQNLVPSITHYLERNAKSVRIAIVIGNAIPFFIYLVWNFIILGVIPHQADLSYGDVAVVSELLQAATPSLSILLFVKVFSLLALLTSFIPCAISFVDFVKDGFRKKLTGKGRDSILIFAIVFVPPFICSLTYPHIFLKSLNFAGGFIDVVLFGIIPSMAILIGRKIKKLAGPYQVIGGNITPLFVLTISIMILFIRL